MISFSWRNHKNFAQKTKISWKLRRNYENCTINDEKYEKFIENYKEFWIFWKNCEKSNVFTKTTQKSNILQKWHTFLRKILKNRQISIKNDF